MNYRKKIVISILFCLIISFYFILLSLFKFNLLTDIATESAQKIEKFLNSPYNLKGFINIPHDKRGNTYLHIVASRGRDDVIKVLIENNADINQQNIDGETCFHEAVESGRFKTVKLLIEYGANVNLKDKNGNTALHMAASNYREIEEFQKDVYDYDKVISILLQKGLSPKTKNNFGKQPFDLSYYTCLNKYRDMK
jgi:ankyrin repeat protein